MSHSVVKQAIPIEFFEQICTDSKLQMLVDDLWGCGNGMFFWFTPPPMNSFGYSLSPMDEIKQEYKVMGGMLDRPFESKEELEAYCTLLEARLEQLKADDSRLAQRKVRLEGRTYEQIASFLLEELKLKFPALDAAEFTYTAIRGGERIKPESDLCYLLPDQVGAIAHVLCQIEVDELLRHFDASKYDPDYWLEECRKTIQAFKSCFAETAERRQIILTKII